jgi:K+-sensing histidine kinase KdpD
MNPRLESVKRKTIGYAWGVATPGVCTLIDWPLRQVLAPSSILMLYLLGVLAVAILFGRGPSVITSLLSAPAFAFFFAPPIFSFAMKDLENIVGLLVMLLIALVTSTSLERMRTQARIARQRERRANALYCLSDALSGLGSRDEIHRIVAGQIRDVLGFSSVLLLPDAEGQLVYPGNLLAADAPLLCDLQQAQAQFERDDGNPKRTGDAGNLFLLKGSVGALGVLAVAPQYLPALADAEEKSFFDMALSQIAQSLERISLTQRAREASIQAETENLRNSLLSAISHDLRTPLTRIVGTASTLVDEDGSLTQAERREFTLAIQDEAQRMAELMSKILDMARIASGKVALHREWNALEEIVGATLTRLDALLKGRKVDIRLPEKLPLVSLDAVLFQQVLANLIENAVKYSPAGCPIEIAADWIPTVLRVVVADRGPGIPEELQGRVFEKFYRVVPESPQSGAGLGLALCRAIVEAHGGKIGAANRPGGGAVFFINLPLQGQPPALDWQENPKAQP